MDKLLLSLIGSKRRFLDKFNSCDGVFVSDYFVVYDDTSESPFYSLCRFRRFGECVYFHVEFRSYYFGNFWKRVVKRNSFFKGTYVVVSYEVLDIFIDELNNLL